MEIDELIAMRFRKPCNGGIDPCEEIDEERSVSEDLYSDDPEKQNAIDRMISDPEKTFREELAELLGVVSSQEAKAVRRARPIQRRMHVVETCLGARRLELSLGANSELLSLVPETLLEEGVKEGQLSYFRIHRGGGRLELVGDIAAIYSVEKARRLGSPFYEEWWGKRSSEHFLKILEAVREAERRSRSGDSREIAVVKVTNFKETKRVLEALDDLLSGPEGRAAREAVEAAGVRWSRWRRAGYGFRALFGMDRMYF